MTDKELAKNLLDVIEEWENNWSPYNQHDELTRLLLDKFKSKLISDIYHSSIWNDTHHIKMICGKVINQKDQP